jgi:hypothetical protein
LATETLAAGIHHASLNYSTFSISKRTDRGHRLLNVSSFCNAAEQDDVAWMKLAALSLVQIIRRKRTISSSRHPVPTR